MRTIAIANQKGGCGKTTTAVNLAASLAEAGRRVLLIDLDPQGHSTMAFGHEPDLLERTIYDCLVSRSVRISDILVAGGYDSMDIAPSNVLLAGAEIKLATKRNREVILDEKLQRVRNEFEICIIDCPPSVGMLTLNALVASAEVIVPVQLNYYSLEGLKQLMESANIIRERFKRCRTRISGLLLTFVENTTVYSRQIQEQVREYFGDLVFDTVIHRNIDLAEAPSAGEPVIRFSPESRGAAEYRMLAEEVLT